ncbi:molybdenum cofactor biosynthesis protein B [Exilibacterium tricleocarpae]|uniref:Molybdenum cofactor biosynthesis protein B n=1 Tax=Exilibacterium tricleocarpae TaxID=2591008 RepID=A0A545U5F7_9GAMM|nr:molybdenum cofactor biosynthesis protein B [Exilibacterium tricleocarpae]TQV84701.1 molybdenum cofactor biosynthesis protein B [Exilibacterium tricleocarpae]
MSKEFTALNCAVLTVSDTRTETTDKSGALLAEALQEAGHRLAEKHIVKDDVYQIRAVVSRWIADPEVQAIVLTGGTGFAGRDSTPEAVAPLFDKEVVGFGELFRHISIEQIGNATVQSRALAGLANKTVIFALPGSTNACRTAWDGILRDQLDSRHQPCNFVELLV